jgi:hypothetical protein
MRKAYLSGSMQKGLHSRKDNKPKNCKITSLKNIEEEDD